MPPSQRRSRFSFTLKTLMLIVLLVAVYLGGRYGEGPSSPAALDGTWQAQLPAGFQRPVTLQHLADNRFLFRSGASVFNGVYQWNDGQLSVVEPRDARMTGLVWHWDGEQLVLTAEPKNMPTGSSYLGTKLSRVPQQDEK